VSLRDYHWLSVRLGVKRSTLQSKVSRGEIPCVRLGPRLVRFDEAVIERWLSERSVAGTAELARRREVRRIGGAA